MVGAGPTERPCRVSKFALLLACSCLLGGAPAKAFWERSQLQACREAPTAIERERLQCWVFAPVYEWPRPIAADYAPRPLRHKSPRWRK
jgi:hypothetical protein